MEKAVINKIVVSVSGRNKGNRLLKIKCPFCGKEHTHGGGVEGEDIRLYGGSRVSHCWKGAGIGNMYELVFPDEINFTYKSVNTAEILPFIRNGNLNRGAYTVNIAPGAFSEILGNQVLVYTHGKPDSDILAFSAREFLSLIESAKKLPQEQFRALVTERYISRQDVGQASDCPAVQNQKEAQAREEISLIESEALAVGWERDQLDELARCIRVYMPNCGIGEISLRAIQIIHFYPDGTIRSYANFYNMRVEQPWIKKVTTPPTFISSIARMFLGW